MLAASRVAPPWLTMIMLDHQSLTFGGVVNSSEEFVPPKPKEFDITAIGPAGNVLALDVMMVEISFGFWCIKLRFGGAAR